MINNSVETATNEVLIQNENSQQTTIQLQSNLMSLNSGRIQISNLQDSNESYDMNGDLLIDNVTNSTISISGNVNSIRIKNVSDSKIEVKNICAGSIYIENVRNGTLKVAGDQIRIHDCVNVDFFIFTRSSCILEDCENLRFHPNKDAASLTGKEDESYWKSIQDFGFNPEGSFTLVESN